MTNVQSVDRVEEGNKGIPRQSWQRLVRKGAVLVQSVSKEGCQMMMGGGPERKGVRVRVRVQLASANHAQSKREWGCGCCVESGASLLGYL